jgi:hypothetical protein
MIVERNYTNKPSITTLKANIRKAIADGGTFIVLRWGENQVNVEHTQWGWVGRGWIGRNGGQDIANELNKA